MHYEWLSESELYPYEFKSKQIEVFLDSANPKVTGEPKKMSSIKKGGNKQKGTRSGLDLKAIYLFSCSQMDKEEERDRRRRGIIS